MNKEKIEIVEFVDDTYAIRKSNKYGNHSFLDRSDLTYWWSKDYVKNAKTTDLEQLKRILAKVSTPEELSLGTPMSSGKIEALCSGSCPVKVGTDEPVVTQSVDPWDTARSPITKVKKLFKRLKIKL